ncbi:hypothetical protein D9613_009045 [Agrocybe pediades]|uniref:GmrSD restriction endonucleases N-terminal domain-containing protein n=1 Tax=Agrocybe pediades TaxID=84607 RepID=A0A8H4VU50_9AGAR|nr:hypothetical protein D9613_009045 [Agrocybe pediades]
MQSEDELSDLTDLESEDDSNSNFGGGGTGKKRAKSGYKIRKALKPPRATTYTAQALFGLSTPLPTSSKAPQTQTGFLTEQPKCTIARSTWKQNTNAKTNPHTDIVWTETKQIGLIDSIFRNFYIPPVIFSVQSYDDGSERKICIDGKQRLTAISLFMNGQIPHRDPFTNEKLWYREPRDERAKKSYKLLPLKYQKQFANKQIVCVEYQEITDADEREIFQRVQLGVALTPAEKLMVIKTPRADFIRSLQTTHMKEPGGLSSSSLDWNTARGSDYRSLAIGVYCMEKFSGDLKMPGMPQIERWLSPPSEPKDFDEKFKKEVRIAYQIFSDIIQDTYKLGLTELVLRSHPRLSPVEFMFISVMIYVHKDTASLAQLAHGIGQLREHVRSTHVDIRSNSRVMRTATEFIVRWKPPKGKVKGDDGVPAGRKVGGGMKRKRAGGGGGREEEAEEGEAEDDRDDDAEEGEEGEEDELEGDTDGDVDMDDGASYPVSKKKARSKPKSKSSSSSKKIKPDPDPFTCSSQFHNNSNTYFPTSDRLAAQRRAKEEKMAEAQRQVQMQHNAAVREATSKSKWQPVASTSSAPAPTARTPSTFSLSGLTLTSTPSTPAFSPSIPALLPAPSLSTPSTSTSTPTSRFGPPLPGTRASAAGGQNETQGQGLDQMLMTTLLRGSQAKPAPSSSSSGPSSSSAAAATPNQAHTNTQTQSQRTAGSLPSQPRAWGGR